MSIEIEAKSQASGPLPTPELLDLSGLPRPIADELRRLVGTLRTTLAHGPTPAAPAEETPEEKIRRLHAWVNSHPSRSIVIDDSRESIYDRRGE